MFPDALNDYYINPLDLSKKHMTYFNIECKVTATTNMENNLQNEMMRKLSRAACKQDPLMHMHAGA